MAFAPQARSTSTVTLRLRTAQRERLKALGHSEKLSALIRVLLDLLLIGEFEDKHIWEFLEDEVNYSKNLDKNKKRKRRRG